MEKEKKPTYRQLFMNLLICVKHQKVNVSLCKEDYRVEVRYD